MSCCCTKTLDYCKQGICQGELDLDVLAQIEGTHKFVIDFLSVQITIEAAFEVDEKIIFPINLLNENFQYTGTVYDPNGAKVIIRKNDIDYDCIRFQTVLNITLTHADVVES